MPTVHCPLPPRSTQSTVQRRVEKQIKQQRGKGPRGSGPEQVEEGGRKESGKPAWPTTCHMGGSRGTEQELGGSGRRGLPPLLSSAREIGALKQEPELATILDCIGCAGKS